jgi:hypothetical protein
MLDGLGDDATGDHRLSEPHLVRHQEAVRGVAIEIQSTEGVLNGASLEGLQA